MKKLTLTLALVIFVSVVYSQQFSLYNSRTLYDAFENPSQKAFQADSSRKYAFNFFIPTASFNGRFSGPAESNFGRLIYNQVIDGRDITLGESEMNTLTAHTNSYILMLRIFSNVNFN